MECGGLPPLYKAGASSRSPKPARGRRYKKLNARGVLRPTNFWLRARLHPYF